MYGAAKPGRVTSDLVGCHSWRVIREATEADLPRLQEIERAAGRVFADVVDGNGHVEQVSVDPAYARRGIGRALLEHVAEWAHGRGAQALTLTTFTEVAWNGPYYKRCGFGVLADDELTPGLVAIRKAEAAHGLDRWPRACLRSEL